MGFETPRLDDRHFNDIVEEARRRIPLYCPEWTDHNLSDPGITMVELFAWMTDLILYRLNRVPDKHFIKFMELIGMRLREAEPARVPVTFWLSAPQPVIVKIPSGTAVATVRTENEAAIIFTTDRSAEIKVPRLQHVMTSPAAADDDGRRFNEHDISRLASGYEGFPVFASDEPTSGDAFYLGFEDDLSDHIIGIEMDIETRAEGAGIDPMNPPYVWEVLSSETGHNWTPCEIDDDSSKGLNVPGTVKLHLPHMSRGTRSNQAAFWLRLRLDPKPGMYGYDVSPQIKQLSVEAWGITIRSTNVNKATEEVIGRSDGSPGQQFFLAHTPVVPRRSDEYLVVRQEDGREEAWEEVTDFSTSEAENRHYTIDSQTGEIRFGPALPQRDGTVRRYGQIPAKNAMIVMRAYHYGGGLVGNVSAHTLTVLKSALPYIDRVSNRFAAEGGLDAEHLDDAKHRVPGYLRSLKRAVTASDFEYLAQEAANGLVGRVHCIQPPATTRGEVKVLVIPKVPQIRDFISPESLHLKEDLRTKIESYLDERRLLSTRMEVLEPSYQWVQTEVRFRASEHYQQEEVRQEVRQRLFRFLNPLTGGLDGKGWPFGRDLYLADIMAVLLSVPGVDFIRSVKLYPVDYREGRFTLLEAVDELPIVTQGIIASYNHDVTAD